MKYIKQIIKSAMDFVFYIFVSFYKITDTDLN